MPCVWERLGMQSARRTCRRAGSGGVVFPDDGVSVAAACGIAAGDGKGYVIWSLEVDQGDPLPAMDAGECWVVAPPVSFLNHPSSSYPVSRVITHVWVKKFQKRVARRISPAGTKQKYGCVIVGDPTTGTGSDCRGRRRSFRSCRLQTPAFPSGASAPSCISDTT